MSSLPPVNNTPQHKHTPSAPRKSKPSRSRFNFEDNPSTEDELSTAVTSIATNAIQTPNNMDTAENEGNIFERRCSPRKRDDSDDVNDTPNKIAKQCSPVKDTPKQTSFGFNRSLNFQSPLFMTRMGLNYQTPRKFFLDDEEVNDLQSSGQSNGSDENDMFSSGGSNDLMSSGTSLTFPDLRSSGGSFSSPFASSSSPSLATAIFNRMITNTGILTVIEAVKDDQKVVINKGPLTLKLLGQGANQEAWKVEGKDLVIKFPLDSRVDNGTHVDLTYGEKKRIVAGNITAYTKVSEKLQSQIYSTSITLVKTYEVAKAWQWGFTVSEYVPERATFDQVLPLLKEIMANSAKHIGDLTPDNLHVRNYSNRQYELVIIDPYYDDAYDNEWEDPIAEKACDLVKTLKAWAKHESISLDEMIQKFDDVKHESFWKEIEDRL